MSSTTTNLGLVKMASGETIGQWSDANNGSGQNLDKIDTAIGTLNSQLVLRGTVTANSSVTLEPRDSGAHIVLLRRDTNCVLIAYDYWETGYSVLGGTLPSGVTITKSASSHNVTIASTRSSALAYVAL